MRCTSAFRKLVAVMVFLVLAVGQVMPALAQSEDGLVSDDGSPAPAAIAPAATWVDVLCDEFCSYPNGWVRDDYNGTGHNWVKATVDGRCTARPSGIGNKMNVTTWRTVSVAGGANPQAVFRFKMNTEPFWDFVRVEYSCNSGQHFWGTPSALSGVYGWTTASFSLANCAGSSNLRVRLTFQTDKIILSTQAPTLDYFKVRHWK